MERYRGLRLILVWVFFCAASALAQTLPQTFVIEGRLFDTGTGLPINATADVKLEIMVQGNTSCVFYRDTYLGLNLASSDSNSQGVFSLKLGGATSYISSSVSSFTQLFSADSMKGDADGDGFEDPVCSPVSTSPTAAYRVVRISVRSPSGSGSYIALSPDTLISSIPNALVADTLRGKAPADFIAVNTSGASLSQANVENAFSTSNYPKLTALLDGTAGDFIHSTPTSTVNLNGQLLTGIATPAGASDAANKSYVDENVGGKTADVSSVSATAGEGYTLTWSQGQNKWVAQAASAIDNTKLPLLGGTMAGGITMAGFDIYNTGHITMAPQRLLNLGTFTNAQESSLTLAAADKGKILYNSDRAEIRLWTGSAFTGLTAPVTSVAGKTGTVVIDAGDIASAAGQYLTYQPNGVACATGEILKWGSSRWECAADNNAGGTITQIVTATGLTGGGTTSAVTLGVNVGTGPNQIVQLNTNSDLPLIDGHLLFNLNAERIQGRAVSSTLSPTDGQSLKWNGLTNTWDPQDDLVGITALTGDVNGAGTGSITTTISNGAVTNAKIADGSITTVKIADSAVTSAKINNSGNTQNRLLITDSVSGAGITYATCLTNQVLIWTGTGWTCTNSTSLGLGGTITGVTAGTGLTGGGTSGTVALAVNAGTSASQIVQLDASARLPAVDGGLLSNVNASRLGMNAVSTAAPAASGQVLTWNQATTQWEPQNVQPSSNSFVNGGNSFGSAATIGTTDNSSFTLITNSLPRMTILNGGQIGIGTLSPVRDLTVANASANATLGVTSPTGGTSTVYFGDSVNDARGAIQYSSTLNTMKFMTASSTRMIIDNAGNVGIGTTPSTALDVNGSINGSQLCINSDCHSTWPSGGGGTVTSVSSSNADIGVTNGSLAPVLTLNSGTTGGASDANKLAKLDGSGLLTAAMVPNLSASKITTGTLPIARGGTNSTTALNNYRVMISSGGAIVENASLTSGRALASDANGLPVASSATDIELGYLSGVTSSIQSQLSAKQSSLGYTPVNVAGDTMTGALKLPVNGLVVGTSQLVVSGGKVGIGNAAPDRGLLVQSTASLDSDIGVVSGLGKNSTLYFGDIADNANGAIIYNNSFGSMSFRSGSQMYATIKDGSMFFGGSGTASAGAVAEFFGNNYTNSSIIVPRGTTGNRPPTGVGGMVRYNSDNNKFEAFENGVWTNMIGSSVSFPLQAPTSVAGAPAYSFSTSTNTGMYNPATNSIGFSTSGFARMVIDASGNVGIGAPVPASTLDVAGTVHSKGQIYSSTQQISSGSTVDFNVGGNIAVFSAPGGNSITLTNMLDGGSYVIIISDTTSRMYTFSGCGTSYFNPANAATTASTQTIYNILRVGTACYISWASGYQ